MIKECENIATIFSDIDFEYQFAIYEIPDNLLRKTACFNSAKDIDFVSMMNQNTIDLTEIQQTLQNDMQKGKLFLETNNYLRPLVWLHLSGKSKYIYNPRLINNTSSCSPESDWYTNSLRIVTCYNKPDNESLKPLTEFATSSEAVNNVIDTTKLLRQILSPKYMMI